MDFLSLPGGIEAIWTGMEGICRGIFISGRVLVLVSVSLVPSWDKRVLSSNVSQNLGYRELLKTPNGYLIIISY